MAASDEDSVSPNNRIKLLCSYGGRILPRPTDGQLKYVGGETRVIAVPRSITFTDLSGKISEMFNSEVVIKYQIMPEDLDALVSVRSDEDLHHMLDEYDHHPRSPTASGSPRFRFRLFLFPSAAAAPPPPSDCPAFEGINGIRPIFTLSSSAGTSPTGTIDSAAMINADAVPALAGLRLPRGGGMHKVRSTPNLSGAQQGQMAGNGPVASPQFHHRYQQQHKFSPAYGAFHPGGGPWRMGPAAQLMNGAQCGCGRPIVGHQGPYPTMRRYYSPATAAGGCTFCGHGDEAGAPRSGRASPSPVRRRAFE